jgi:hypothetical protein
MPALWDLSENDAAGLDLSAHCCKPGRPCFDVAAWTR